MTWDDGHEGPPDGGRGTGKVVRMRRGKHRESLSDKGAIPGPKVLFRHTSRRRDNPDSAHRQFGFEWPDDLTVESLGRNIGTAVGLRVELGPIPEEVRHREISGLTVMIDATAHVYFDAELSPLNREQTILHEYAHILHRDVRAHSDATHLRCVFDDPIEKRAETTGMRLLDELHRRRQERDSRGASEVLAFFSGNDARRAS
ncbi:MULTISPECIES: hypothetical protein [Brachybacterium]|uniref:IrrE N-terminal-like domain-containing protein n=1 Tax=Brachybacterium kimchii TaxID=2942909 RepID=A0ABY4NAZ2_9MICO|nr:MULTISPECIES: hypothetical protein [Brachybacterium]MCG7308042.1 hypothetical protein [Brachybacterium sp. ACRRE]UQN30593.1 hypothetical protein M4486_04575 [Brachybacterium kimchii]